jgi:HEAT repeat protein
MNRLQEWDPEAWKAILLENLPSLLAHDRTQVRKKVLESIEQLGLVEAIPVLNGILQKKDDPEVMAAALAALAALGGPDTLEKTAHFSRDPNPVIQRGTLVALMRYGGIDGVLEAGQVFKELVQSPDVQKRILAAEILEEVNSAQFYQPLVALINDHDPGVRRAAIRAAGSINNPHLWPALLDACASPEIQNQAEQALVSVGPPILPFIAARLHCSLDEMPSYLEDTEIRSAESFIDICGRIGGEEAINILITQLGTHNMTLRQGVISALRHCEFRSVPGDIQLNLLLSEEAHLGAWLIAFQARPENSPRALLLDSVLAHMLRDVRDRMLGILSFQYDAQSMQRAHMALSEGGSSKEALAIEVIENQLPSKIKSWVMPFLEQSSLDEKLKRLQSANIHVSLPEGDAALLALLDGNIHLPTDTAQSDPIMFSAWTRASILHLIGTHGLRKCLPSVLASCSSNNLLVRKSAEWARDRLEENTKGVVMLSPIEKILILKSASVFSNVPDDALADVVFHLDEMDVAENETIFNKGEPGDSMYIVVCGKVRIHDKERTLNDLGEGDVFGEMALLDPEPRSASVTAVEPSRLLRLEQEPFMDLLAQQPVVATGIIRNLAKYLRARVEDINHLDARLREVEGAQNG